MCWVRCVCVCGGEVVVEMIGILFTFLAHLTVEKRVELMNGE